MVWSLLVFFHLLQICYLVFGFLFWAARSRKGAYLYLLARANIEEVLYFQDRFAFNVFD